MRLIKIGLANIDSTVGAFTANVDQCIDVARALASEDVTIALFPEQVVGGYTPEDLVQWRGFVDGQLVELRRFADETAQLPMVSVIGAALWMQGLRYNCAVVVGGGEILGVVPKEKLPTYSIFYEGRTTSRGLHSKPATSMASPSATWSSASTSALLLSRSVRTSGARMGRSNAGPTPVRN